MQVGAQHRRRVGHAGIHIGNESDLFECLVQDFFLLALRAGVFNRAKMGDKRVGRHEWVLQMDRRKTQCLGKIPGVDLGVA
jgi:hypothetical protein